MCAIIAAYTSTRSISKLRWAERKNHCLILIEVGRKRLDRRADS